jgi:Asp-tRNA(Asn)/Glu-tRNA(Gln) amidotransferase C subunit
VPRPCPPRSKILANAPDSEEGMFRVPPILE